MLTIILFVLLGIMFTIYILDGDTDEGVWTAYIWFPLGIGIIGCFLSLMLPIKTVTKTYNFEIQPFNNSSYVINDNFYIILEDDVASFMTTKNKIISTNHVKFVKDTTRFVEKRYEERCQSIWRSWALDRNYDYIYIIHYVKNEDVYLLL